jgi:hypothetical protein
MSSEPPEQQLGVLGDVAGLDVIELGCGTAYFSAWLARRGARPTGFAIDDLREIYAPPDATDHPYHQAQPSATVSLPNRRP